MHTSLKKGERDHLEHESLRSQVTLISTIIFSGKVSGGHGMYFIILFLPKTGNVMCDVNEVSAYQRILILLSENTIVFNKP